MRGSVTASCTALVCAGTVCLAAMGAEQTTTRAQPVAVQVVTEEQNVVASELIGKWVVDAALSGRLGGRSDHFGKVIEFRRSKQAEHRVLKQLAVVIEALSAKRRDSGEDAFLPAVRKIYLIGEVTSGGMAWDFALASIFGNPHLLLYDRGEDWESENVMLARDKAGGNDLLFLGGDFNNQSFGAYHRATANGSTAPE